MNFYLNDFFTFDELYGEIFSKITRYVNRIHSW